MVLLSISITFAILVTIGFPIVVAIWLNKQLAVPWRVITYGALAYFIVQALITLIFNGLIAMIEAGTITIAEPFLVPFQLALSIFFGALLGVLIRWAGMKYLKENLQNLESAYGIGVGFGGIESILRVGLPLLVTFITMLSNINIDPQTTNLDPAIVEQLEALWAVPFYVPLAGSLERLAALVMHIAVTILILQVFKSQNGLWLIGAVGLEIMVNGLIAGLSEAGVDFGWVILLSIALMIGNLYLVFRLNGYEFDITRAKKRT